MSRFWVGETILRYGGGSAIGCFVFGLGMGGSGRYGRGADPEYAESPVIPRAAWYPAANVWYGVNWRLASALCSNCIRQTCVNADHTTSGKKTLGLPITLRFCRNCERLTAHEVRRSPGVVARICRPCLRRVTASAVGSGSHV